MKIFDQHVHSKYSPDSKESLKNYVKHASEMGLEYFIITDHVDFDYPFYKCNWIFDPHQEAKELQELQKQYPNVLLQLGVELGYKRKELQRLLDFKNSYNFDLTKNKQEVPHPLNKVKVGDELQYSVVK